MDKNAIKKYAVWARRELIERVSQRALVYGITAKDAGDPNAESVNGHLLSQAEKRQRQALIRYIKEKGYEQVMEEVAYTWFNRFAALRFMEVNGYLPSHIRVFTNDAGEFKPQILAEAIHLELDGLDMKKVYELESANKSEELFKYLLIVQCNALNSILPGMFQRIDDYTELLLPDYLLREGSVIEQMVTTIPENDWTDQVQIIGWLYQYYNTEPKDKVFADLKKNIKITKENIPAATQLFTPDWIVHYMVENSLGRIYIDKRKNEGIFADGRDLDEMTWEEIEAKRIANEKYIAEQMGWKYFLPEAEQTREVGEQLDKLQNECEFLDVKDIKVIDPCCGSGHILAYLFDVLVQIYESYGYTSREAVGSIVEKNLWGLDIDDRAAQLAYFSVMMKARQYDRRFFTHPVQPNVYAIPESNWIGGAFPFDMGDFLLSKEHQETLDYLINVFQDAKEYGSILQLEQRDYAGFIEAWELTASQTADKIGLLLWYDAIKDVIPELAKVAIALTQKYQVVVTNPPYMGASNMNGTLVEYIKKNYPNSKSDASTAFMERTLQFCGSDGLMAMINIPVWMFLSSYEKLRQKLIAQNTILNMVHPGRGIFGSDFGTTTFIIAKQHIKNYTGTYRRLFDKQGEVESIEEREQAFLVGKGSFTAQQDNFSKIPGSPVAYWVSDRLLADFEIGRLLGTIADSKQGIATADNNRYLRLWYEVARNNIKLDAISHDKAAFARERWFPYNKGGEFRKWYGNNDFVVNWFGDGTELKNDKKAVLRNQSYYFRQCFSWSLISSSVAAFRYKPAGHIFDVAGMSCFSQEYLLYLLALCNSKVVMEILNIIAPTINYQCGDIANIPVIMPGRGIKKAIEKITDSNISISRADWDSFETSWDFTRHPLVRSVSAIAEAYGLWETESNDRFNQLKANEEELNRIFIDIYGLQDELTPEVEDKDVTVRKADLGREIRSLISYAVGCMFGRYSLDVDGLAYAGGEWDATKYATFQPDKDAIIPICDDDYFEDDIMGRFVEWMETVYGKETLEENLRFIADALGGKGSSREVIRSYFINDFYADHLKVYQKRPIYWLFDSGKKNGFKCLIYMHRYQPDTIARIRTDYVHEQQSRYRTAIADLEQRINGASTSERVKLSKQLTKLQAQAEEVQVYEEKIHHLADQMINIDLDDGVKHNYEIFKDVLAKIK